MKQLRFILLLALISTFGFSTPLGLLYTNVTETVAIGTGTNYTKQASGGTMTLLGLIGLGNASAEEIAKSGGITKISRVDKQTNMLLGIFYWETFTVFGD